MTAPEMLARTQLAAIAHMQQPSVDHLPDEDRRQILVDRTKALLIEMQHQLLDALTAEYFERQDLIRLLQHRLLPAANRGIL